MSEEKDGKLCVACGRGPREVPLLVLEYRDAAFRICPQHLPVLIHDPTRLAGSLPGAELMQPSEHQD
jgi:hypothetical protein